MQNPNKTKNRVPTDRELISLREIASRKGELLKSINSQLSEAQGRYDEIMARYESILSELHAAKRHAAMLQTQKAMISNEMNEICGVLHPVRRLPVETLRHIFEETLEASTRAKLWQATQLSYVCQHWRAVSLNDPSLWSDIIVDFRKPVDAITEYWNRAVERVKMVPSNVCFNNFGGEKYSPFGMWGYEEEEKRKVAACGLLRIPIIRKLEINADTTCPIIEALSMIAEFPTGQLESFKLGKRSYEMSNENSSWDWGVFLHQFPPTRLLALEHLPNLSFSQSKSFSSLLDLRITFCGDFDAMELLCLCPTLERLVIQGCYGFYKDYLNQPPIAIVTLTALEVTDGGTFPWGAPLHFPSLSTLVVHMIEDDLPDEIYSFLANHPSISNLDVFIDTPDVIQLATMAPQLTKFTVFSYADGLVKTFSDLASASLQGPAFPRLEVLDLRDTFINMEEFDHFIKTRCLPAEHIKSELIGNCRPLRELVVTLPKTHTGSRLIAEATRIEKGDDGMTSLSWL
ncbi:hypothetical protein M408DRAFT_26993 [Serendipita vermifera MAFF 305830]|uniref:Uncharacterized protein n=1 Tax=Serendipita vermifera MAFF 305830 TaxID=933852 RepID=A0A0C3AX16_SERVB|nr:hypothetical protein M408DRAFT_26993 [Serendipita vermifera MAFF 305830]